MIGNQVRHSDVDLVAKKAVHPLLRAEIDELATTLYAA